MMVPSFTRRASSLQSRRTFIVALGKRAGATTLALQLPWLATIASCTESPRRRTTLDAAEMLALRAFASQIIPADAASIGAAEAGAAEFIDRILARPLYARSAPVVRAGLADLDARARRVASIATFASLERADQLAIVRDVQATPFFDIARTLVVVGTFADPSYGGNRNGAAWRMIGIEHQPSYSPPYGWYDAATVATAN